MQYLNRDLHLDSGPAFLEVAHMVNPHAGQFVLSRAASTTEPLAAKAGCEMTLGQPHLHSASALRRIWIAGLMLALGAATAAAQPALTNYDVEAKALLAKNPRPTREEIRHALSGVLCRCTGYSKIIDAVQAAARAETL